MFVNSKCCKMSSSWHQQKLCYVRKFDIMSSAVAFQNFNRDVIVEITVMFIMSRQHAFSSYFADYGLWYNY